MPDDIKLPPRPEPSDLGYEVRWGYYSDDMDNYAIDAVLADRASRWLPIETAPRDGTRVLCLWGTSVHEGWCAGAGTAIDGGDSWRAHSLVLVSGRPTHWQPLPAPLEQEPT